MKPRLDYGATKLVFGDKMITSSLVDSIGMSNALLRCDNWHMLNEVWPHHDAFGRMFGLAPSPLRAMLESSTEEGWQTTYKEAR